MTTSPVARESDLERKIALALSRAGIPLWRNNVGLAWVGEFLDLREGILRLRNPRRFHAGLAIGSSDRIGIGPGGRMVSLEIKTDRGVSSDEQKAWLRMVTDRGGIAGVARSVEDAMAIVGRGLV